MRGPRVSHFCLLKKISDILCKATDLCISHQICCMNHFIFIMCLLPTANTWAQNSSLPTALTDTSELRKQPLLALKNNNLWLSKARFSHTTDKGQVYTMPIDNMPCLVPDMKKAAPMPIHRMPKQRMPNLYRFHPRVPQSK
jgi:hypothetical protein